MHTSRLTSFSPNTKEVSHMAQQESGRLTGYRLQTSAYVNRGEQSSLYHTRLDFASAPLQVEFPHRTSVLSVGNGSLGANPKSASLINHKPENNSKSLLQLPSIVIEDITDNTQHTTPSLQHASSADNLQSSSQKQLHSIQPLHSSTSITVALPTHRLRSKTARLSVPPTTAHEIHKNRRRRFSLEDDPNRLAMKVSLPCTEACCYCVYTTLLGPVKVYFTRADKPKKEPLLLSIKDGNGKPVIPVSRKSDVRGLVYDPTSHSLHPPVRGQRPVFKEHRWSKKVK